MRIGIYGIEHGRRASGGSDVYFMNLALSLASSRDGHEYFVFISNRETKKALAGHSHAGFRVIYYSPLYISMLRAYARVRTNPFMTLMLLLNLISRTLIKRNVFRIRKQGLYREIIDFDGYKLDALHFPLTTIEPSCFGVRIPIVLTVHDIQQEYYPDFFDKETLLARRERYRSSAERADLILTISEYTKKCLIEKYQIKSEKIIVTYQGVSPAFEAYHASENGTDIRGKYGLPRDYILYPAASWPHKNHVGLLKALEILKSEYQCAANLVLLGLSMANEKNTSKAIQEYGLSDQVRVLGYVPLEDLIALYSSAVLMVFPSLFEGFGIPLVEAMRMGVPIACSDRTSVPEIAGNAAVYFNPEDPADMARGIYSLLKDDALGRTLVEKGCHRAKMFTWEETVKKTVAAYESLHG